MQYEKTEVTNNIKGISNKMLIQAASKVSTGSLIWLLVKRHKVALLATSNAILLISFVFPPWFDILLSVVK